MDTQIIELSISKNYVCNWGLWEAIREILQNAQDADKEGYALSVDTEDNGSTLIIKNDGPRVLDISSLVLGNSVKSEGSIGKYGEGYKLALVVLLRLGYDVIIYNGDCKWTPYFEYSDTYKIEVLKIKVSPSNLENDGIKYVIGGLSSSDLSMLKDNSLVIAKQLGVDLGRTISSDYGDVLLADMYSGKFYVEGLYIQDDDSFEYGYSFNSDVVDLDRDRRAINYYDLLNLTTDTLLSQTDDFEIVEYCLVENKKDTTQLDNFYHQASEEFAKGYAKHFMEQHNIDEDTFVGTEKEVMLSGAPKTFVTDSVQASIVNQGLDKSDSYQYVKQLAKKKDDATVAWTYYNQHPLKKMHQWLVTNCKRLSSKQINNFIDICKEIKPSYFDRIEEHVYENLDNQLRSADSDYKGY